MNIYALSSGRGPSGIDIVRISGKATLKLCKKLTKLKSILYDGNKQNFSIKLAEKILSSNNKAFNIKDNDHPNNQLIYNTEKIEQILNKMRLLLNNNKK